ncbi:MAG TPA: serine/threonine-protein kinase [Gemmatimonadaceae bacterium]|nr:serine/threonine-protein kinase [Gemmatimonadaceae bacterium]
MPPTPPDQVGETQVVAPPEGDAPLETSQLGSGQLREQPTSEAQSIAVLKVCPQCGTEYETAARFCPTDGTALRPKGSDSLVGCVLADRYHILKRIGEGGMGRVYLGEHVKMNRQCAIKVMSPALVNDAESASRFAREASNAARIIHPNVAAVFDYGESDGLVYLVMEYVDGEPLSRLLAREAPFALERAVDLARQIADALGAAHELGIVHRDLKPDNILVARSKSGKEVVKVVDFGIAKAMQEGAGEALTRTGLVIGTPEFMSPEQLLGDPVDARSDLYALGCILHLMLTAAPAFEAPTREQMIKRRLSEEPPHAQEIDPGIPDSIDRIIGRLLARSPGDRYGSAAEVRDALGGTHTRRLSSDGTVMPRMETPRSAPTVVFGAAESATERTPLQSAERTAEVAPITVQTVKPRRRGPWLAVFVLLVAAAAIVFVVMSNNAREARQQLIAKAQRDSVQGARAVDSSRIADSLRLATTAPVVMVDTVAQRIRQQADSIANARRALTNGLLGGIRLYTSALQQGDMNRARAAFPNVSETEQRQWQSAMEKYDLKIRVGQPANIALSSHDSVASFNVVLQVQYIDKSTKQPTSAQLRRRATLVRQGTGWQLTALTPA